MSGKIFARASAISLALILAACGGDDNSASLGGVGSGGSGGGTTDGGSTDGGTTGGGDSGAEPVVALGNGSEGGFNEGSISASTKSLGPGGKSTLEVSIVDQASGNTLVSGQEVTVTFSSSCLDGGQAALSANPVTVSSGTARTTYTATGCVGDDLVTASTGNAEASVLLTVEAGEPIAFVTFPPEPNSISPANTSGNALESRAPVSRVSFKLIDESASGIAGRDVEFRLFPEDSDASIDSSSDDQTGSDGLATAIVKAGPTHEVVRVIASTTNSEGDPIETTSGPIAINSYIPTDANFSISLSNFLVDSWNIDGVAVDVNINAADRYGNAIRGNTIVNFTTSNGKITPDCELSENGSCTVIWESLATREVRPEIFAYTQGEVLVSGTNCHSPDSTCEYEFATLEEPIRLVQTSSDGVQVTLTNPSGNEYCASTSVSIPDVDLGATSVAPPSGTTIAFTATAGEILNASQASKTIGSGSNLVNATEFVACVNATPDAAPSEPPLLRVVVTPPGGNAAEAFVSL